MKALSLWQPWASLMADGRKKIETRHWRPPAWLIGQEMAIHATMRVDNGFSSECGYDPLTIPRGCIVAIVRLDKFEKFTEAFKKEIMLYPEGRYGDFEIGRFGWFCTLIEKLNPPIQARGHQSIWDWAGNRTAISIEQMREQAANKLRAQNKLDFQAGVK